MKYIFYSYMAMPCEADLKKAKQELSFLLNNKYPNQFIPLYIMVSFTTIPYSIALKRSGIQNMILD